MSARNDRERWVGLCDGSACPICLRREPLDVIATLDATGLTMQENAPVRGYVCLVSKVHAIELHDLPEEMAVGLMRDVRQVSRILSKVTGAV